jgi:L-threonylcarbamoyladenylate synthase
VLIKTTTPETLAAAAGLLKSGGVVVLPTDTVYGIAAHPAHPEAVERIRVIKGRDDGKPVALLASSTQAVTAFGATMPTVAQQLAHAYWPGALTLVLPCGEIYEGFRVPDHPFTRALLEACGGTLRVTSANRSGNMPALSATTALHDVGLEADMVIDGGIAPGGIASTVVQISADGTVRILREGVITAAAISACHGKRELPAPGA